MNWFERYGIVGIYYVILSSILLISLSSIDSISSDKINIIIAIVAGISLPIGYLISILSQNIYYLLPESEQVHKTACKETKIFLNCKEIELESLLTVLNRSNPDDFKDLEYQKWLQDYTRKRWDVFSISSSMLIATILAWIPIFLWKPILLWKIILLFTNKFLIYYPFHFILTLFILSVISSIILLWSRKLMFRQIIVVYKEILRKWPDKHKRNCTKSNSKLHPDAMEFERLSDNY